MLPFVFLLITFSSCKCHKIETVEFLFQHFVLLVPFWPIHSVLQVCFVCPMYNIAFAASFHKTANIGESVQFDCQSSSGTDVRWDRKLERMSTSEPIYTGKPNESNRTPRFNVTFSDKERLSRLTIVDVRPSDAGVYMCISRTDAKVLMNATLGVNGKNKH